MCSQPPPEEIIADLERQLSDARAELSATKLERTAARESLRLAEAELQRVKTARTLSHHSTCSSCGDSIGASGCVCRVVNKYMDDQREARAERLAEALRRIRDERNVSRAWYGFSVHLQGMAAEALARKES